MKSEKRQLWTEKRRKEHSKNMKRIWEERSTADRLLHKEAVKAALKKRKEVGNANG